MDRIHIYGHDIFIDLPHSQPAFERTCFISFIETALASPVVDKSWLLSHIPVSSQPSSASLRTLSVLLSALPGQWPTFDLICCYARLWKSLPEAAKAGQSSTDKDFLERIASQVQGSYTDLVTLLPTSSDAAIIDSSSRSNLTHAGLAKFVRNFRLPIRQSLQTKPIVALALPNGPLIGLAIIAIMSYCTAAPISVSSGAEQFRSDVLQSKATTLMATRADVIRLDLEGDWIKANSIEVILVEPNADMTFNMTPLAPGAPQNRRSAVAVKPNGPNDIALLLFTSGTSGTKKSVPLTVHSMVCGIAFVIESWGLQVNDICLNMMQLFHVGGIIRNLFAPIMAGGSTICCPAFDPNLFWDTVEDHCPTWYYASPSMHSEILKESGNRREALKKSRMRLICNAAGGLLPSLACNLRDTFGCVVLPSYGMTECMPISTPKLDYCLDRPGTSGVSVGPEIGILGGDYQPLSNGIVGRIAVRGAPVFGGYLKQDGSLGKSPFTSSGWFDTGDMGYLDQDGYLFITGRSKEVINRGGELISPFEVEEAVMAAAQTEGSPIHERITAALAFAMPHDVLQEVVGIVLVTPVGALRAGIRSVQEAVKDSLNSVKWPAFVVFMDDLPKNNNKILRVRLAERLGLQQITDATPLAQRHYEAICPPPNTPLSDNILGAPCVVDIDIVTRKMSQAVGPHYEVYVRTAKTDGYPEVILAPSRKSSVATRFSSVGSLTVSLRTELSGYNFPSKFHCLDGPLPYRRGTVDMVRLDCLLEQLPQGPGNSSMLTSVELRIADIFANILNCSARDMTTDSDFFQLGGDSLRAGRLLSELRKEFKLRLPIDLLFTHGSIKALASNIEKLGGGTVREKIEEETAQAPTVGCTETCSPTNPFLLVIQLIPIMLVYPMKRALVWTIFMYMLTATQAWPTTWSLPGRLFNLVISLGVGRATASCIAPFFGIMMKWLIIGKFQEGMYPMWGVYHTRWWLVQKILAVCGKGHFELNSLSLTWYYRLLGAKIGSGVKISPNALLGEYDLLEIGDGVNLDKCICRGFAVEQNTSMFLGKIRLGKSSSVGLNSIVAPGTSLPDGACIGPNSSSWEMNDADESNRDLSANNVPSPNFFLELLFCVPVAGLITFLRAVPWMGGLMGIVQTEPTLSHDRVSSVIDWFAQPHRIGFHYMALILHNYFGPMAWFIAVLVLKKLLDISIGKLRPGPAHSRSQLQKLRMSVLKHVVPLGQFHKLLEIFGLHYEFTSMVYRAMGSKVGKRVYWPGTGPAFQDFDLLDIGDNVVFGSRSHIITSDGTGSERVRVGDSAMVSDRVVLLPGATIGDHTVLGSGALTRRDKAYEHDTVWVGSKAGEAVCLSGSTRRTIDIKTKADRRSITIISKELNSSESDLESGSCSPKDAISVTIKSVSDESSQPATEEASSSSPFGRAFYDHKAPYHVYSLSTIFVYSSFITIFSAFYWNIASTSSIQIIARILHHSSTAFAPYHWYRPLVIYTLFTALLSLLLTAQALLALAIVISAKWVLLGRRLPGNYNWDTSPYCQRWQLFLCIEKLRRACYGGQGVLGLLTGTHYMVLYFRALGATIGKDCALFAGGAPSCLFTEPDLLTLGERVVVDDASLVCHINSRGVFDLNPLEVGAGSVLRSGSRLLSGARMGKGSVLMEHTLVMAGDFVEDGVTMQGWPADVFEGARAPIGGAGSS